MAFAKTWGIGIQVVNESQVEEAKRNGVSRMRVYDRVTVLGWTIDKAVSTPPKRMKGDLYTEQDVIEAALNGVSYNTFVTRVVTRGWDLVKAKTTPIIKSSFTHRKEVSQ